MPEMLSTLGSRTRRETGGQRRLPAAGRLLLAVAATAVMAAGAGGAQAGAFAQLYRFLGPPDGSLPFGGLVIDGTGNLYGTTRAGGKTKRCPIDSFANRSDGVRIAGCGVLFEVKAGGGGETVLYAFTNRADGAYPSGLPALGENTFFGTNEFGGDRNSSTCRAGCGTVFAFELADSRLTTLHAFTGGVDSGGAYNGVFLDPTGVLYGTVEGGDGANPVRDLAFSLTPPGPASSEWSFQPLHPAPGGGDGEIRSPLVADAAGNLYGTSRPGGFVKSCAADCGTIFKLTPPTYDETTLYTFGGADGANPGALTLQELGGGAIVLYGATGLGGAGNDGTVFEFDPASRVLTTLHAFTGHRDGARPDAAMLLSDGALYGTTLVGGGGNCTSLFGRGCGTVFKLAPAAASLWQETILHVFGGGAAGLLPNGALAIDANGTLYGVTAFGGRSTNCPGGGGLPAGCGTVFAITP